MNGLNINCFLQCYFKIPLPQNALLLPHFHLSHCSHDETYNKSFHFSWLFQALKKKVEVRVPSYKKQNFNYENCFRKFSLHVSLHVCTNFKKEKKNIQHLQINIALAKKLALKKKQSGKNWIRQQNHQYSNHVKNIMSFIEFAYKNNLVIFVAQNKKSIF